MPQPGDELDMAAAGCAEAHVAHDDKQHAWVEHRQPLPVLAGLLKMAGDTDGAEVSGGERVLTYTVFSL